MQVQAQLNRILRLSQDNGNYRRLRRAAETIERDRDYKVLTGNRLSVVTNKQLGKIDSAVTVQGRRNAINRAANGQSAG